MLAPQGLLDEELELELGYQEGLVPMQVEHQEEAGMERSPPPPPTVETGVGAGAGAGTGDVPPK